MTTLSVRGDVRQVLRAIRGVERRDVPRAIVRGVNKAGDVVISETAKSVGADLKLAPARLRKRFNAAGEVKGKRFTLLPARGGRLEALLTVYLRGIPVSQLTRVRQTKRGVHAEGGRFYRGAFRNPAPSGQHHIFRRSHYFEDEGKPGQRRMPIEVLKVPVAKRLENKAGAVLAAGGARAFAREFERQLRLSLRRRGVGG